MILIDSDVFVIDLVYKRDVRFTANRSFLNAIRGQPAATTVFNLLEVCGKTSFVYSRRALQELYAQFASRYALRILLPPTNTLPADVFLAGLIRGAFDRICRKMAFLDALILYTAERHPEAKTFVTWNARHFRGKTSLAVLTPREYLEGHQAGGAGIWALT